MFSDGIIEASDPRWNDALRLFPRYDFHHLPGYVTLEAERRSGLAKAYLLKGDRGAFLVPLIESPVPLTLQPQGHPPLDALAPYGYAGPLVAVAGNETDCCKFISLALARLSEYLRCRNVCAILLRFHPLISPPLQPFQTLGHLVQHGETVCMDLHQTPEQLWSATRHGFRNPINRLERQGFQFELDYSARFLDEFIKIYHDTMHRVGADPHYFFSREYLSNFQRILGPGFVLAHIRSPAGEIVSSGIFTVCKGIVQYHLSGNKLGGQGSDGSKLLLHGIRSWAQSQGLDVFHLGGGVGGRDDTLFNFKSGFASGRANFCTWRLIVDEPAYLRLCRTWERLNCSLADSPAGFFPAYRKMLPGPPALNQQRCA